MGFEFIKQIKLLNTTFVYENTLYLHRKLENQLLSSSGRSCSELSASVVKMAAAKAAKTGAQQTLKYLMGTCMPSPKSNAARVKVPIYEFDENLHMYFQRFDYIFAHDPHKVTKTGDMVLIQTLPTNLTRLIAHQVIEVIFPLGDITDPITGKKVAATVYRDDIKEVNKMYGGSSDTAFDFEKAPPRGSHEGTRDFTHKPVYKKYYENPDDPQPYAV